MQNEQSVLEVLLSRRSVRKFTSEPVREQDIETLLRAGMFAPSARNTRTWELITITKRGTLDALGDMVATWRMLREAPLCIVCCGQYAPGFELDQEFLVQNAVAVTENILLLAQSMGLGACWLGITPTRPHYEPTKQLLHIPEQARVVALIAVGHPASDLAPRPEPQDRFEPQKWHKEQW